jgi:hypothetical protein
MEFELVIIKGSHLIHIDYITADRMIVADGTYQFQMNVNTNKVEELEKEFNNSVAIDDMMKPVYETKSYYPINKFVVRKR